MNKILFYLSGALLTIMSCSSAQKKSASNINQGIEGYIYFVSGNQMPSPDRKPSPPKGIKSTLYIYLLTNINQVIRPQQQSAFYSSIKTKLIKKTESDSTGHFKVQLEPGKYSVFTKKGALFYANIFDNNNNIAPVEVFAGKVTNVEIKIDYNATY
jgi:hypothetical protein